MIIPLVYTSAIQFWLNYHRDFSSILNGNFTTADLPEVYDFQVKHEMAVQIADRLHLTFPLSLMHPGKNDRRKNAWFYTMQRPQALPRNSFVEVCLIGSVRIFAAAPEFCFLQAASVLDLRRLVMLGTELCGIYLYDESAEFGQRSRTPVTNIGKIAEYLEKADCCYGRREAVRAAQYILDRSNSVRESMLSAMAVLPLSQGGQALHGARLNARLNLSEEGRRILGGHSCIGDIVWEEEKTVVEYDSNISHLSIRQHALDKKRSSAMIASGYKVITVTSDSFNTLADTDNLFRAVRKALGRRPADQRLEQYLHKRHELIRIFREFRSNDPLTYPKNFRNKSKKETSE